MVIAVVLVAAALLAVVTMSRPQGPRSLGQLLLVAAVLTLPWGAVQIAGVPIGDFPLALSLVLLLPDALSRRIWLPPSMVIGAALIATSSLLTTFRPPTSAYMASRISLAQSFYANIGLATRSTGNLVSAAKYEIALIVLPLAIIVGCANRRLVPSLGAAWVTGIVISAAVAFTDHTGLTAVSRGLIGFATAGRQSGLTPQPNFVGLETAMAIPLLLINLTSPGRLRRAATIIGLVLCALGIYASGSRGAAGGAVAAVPLTILMVPQLRRWTGRALIVVGLGAIYLLVTSAGAKVLAVLRLTKGATGTTQSDAARANVRTQGINDFLYSPLHGIGWGHEGDAHLVYLQLLAAGGLLGLIGFAVYVGGILHLSWVRLRHVDAYAAVLIASVSVWLVIAVVENQMADQWLYVPLSLLAALIVLSAKDSGTIDGLTGPGAHSPRGRFRHETDDPRRLSLPPPRRS